MPKSQNIFFYLLTYYNDVFLNNLSASRLNIDKTQMQYVVGAAKIGRIAKKYPFFYKWLFNIFSIFYPILYFGYVSILLIKACICWSKCCRIKVECKRLFLLCDEIIIKTGARIGLYNEDDYWLSLPWTTCSKIPEKQQITVFQLMPLKALFRCYIDSLFSFYLVWRRFGYRYCLYTLKAYKWFLYREGLCNIPEDIILYTSSQKDRWTILFDNLPHREKAIVQHGISYSHFVQKKMQTYYEYCIEYNIWILNMPYKLKTITQLYAFSEKEATAIKIGELKCEPHISYIGYNLELTSLSSPRKSILIIGYYEFYAEIEESIVAKLQHLDIDIYLKSHPTINKNKYENIRHKYRFIFIDNDNFYPSVNLVFSYNSTLAIEYRSLGVDVVYFAEINIETLCDDCCLKLCL